jgi:hypothetical protein
MLLFTAFSQTLKQIVHLLVTRKASFEPTQGSGAKEPRTGIYSYKRQVLKGLDAYRKAAKIFQAASVARWLRVAHKQPSLKIQP